MEIKSSVNALYDAWFWFRIGAFRLCWHLMRHFVKMHWTRP